MSLNNKKKTPTASDVFDDDFEVIYEGDLPDISIDDDDDDDYRDVLSGLSDIDHTDYIRKNDYDRLTKKLKDKNRKNSRKSRNQKGKDNFFDTSYYDEDFLDELDDELYDDDNTMDDDYDDSRNGRIGGIAWNCDHIQPHRAYAEKNVGLKFQMSQNRLQKPQKREEKSYSNLSIFC